VRVSPGRKFAVQRALNAVVTDALDEAHVPRPVVYPPPAETRLPAAKATAGDRER
jgi:hypothetical protein